MITKAGQARAGKSHEKQPYRLGTMSAPRAPLSTSPFERLEIARFETHPRSHFRGAGHLDRAYGKPTPATDVDDYDNKLTVVVKRFEYAPGTAIPPELPPVREP